MHIKVCVSTPDGGQKCNPTAITVETLAKKRSLTVEETPVEAEIGNLGTFQTKLAETGYQIGEAALVGIVTRFLQHFLVSNELLFQQNGERLTTVLRCGYIILNSHRFITTALFTAGSLAATSETAITHLGSTGSQVANGAVMFCGVVINHIPTSVFELIDLVLQVSAKLVGLKAADMIYSHLLSFMTESSESELKEVIVEDNPCEVTKDASPQIDTQRRFGFFDRIRTAVGFSAAPSVIPTPSQLVCDRVESECSDKCVINVNPI